MACSWNTTVHMQLHFFQCWQLKFLPSPWVQPSLSQDLDVSRPAVSPPYTSFWVCSSLTSHESAPSALSTPLSLTIPTQDLPHTLPQDSLSTLQAKAKTYTKGYLHSTWLGSSLARWGGDSHKGDLKLLSGRPLSPNLCRTDCFSPREAFLYLTYSPKQHTKRTLRFSSQALSRTPLSAMLPLPSGCPKPAPNQHHASVQPSGHTWTQWRDRALHLQHVLEKLLN